MNSTVIIFLSLEALLALVCLKKYDTYKTPLIECLLSTAFVLFAFAARYTVMDYETLDYQHFLREWVEYFRNNGGFKALSGSIGNYNIPYLYFLALFSYSRVRDLYLIKLLSILFDIVLAYSAAGIAECCGASKRRQAACFIAVLFLPTVFLNAAVWGQCDSIYVSFALLGVYAALKDRPAASMILIAISFGFKLQAVFIMPIYIVLLIARKLKWHHFALFPLTYIALIMPAVALGRPFTDTLSLYFNQMGSVGSGLNYNSPSLFSIFDGYGGLPQINNKDLASKLGIIAAAGSMLMVFLYAYRKRKSLSNIHCVCLCAVLVTAIPLFLPHMHERYFFPSDIMGVITAFLVPETFIVAVCAQFASLLGYHAYLKMQYLLPMRYGAYALMLNLLVLCLLLRHFDRRTIDGKNPS